MGWFNYYGLAIMVIVMIPNIIYTISKKYNSLNTYKNKAVVIAENIGRYGCFVFMILNIPYTYLNFWFNYAHTIYLCINSMLCFIYIIFWLICWNKKGKLKAMSLSITPSCIFLFSGIVLANIPLIIFAIIFGINHILISYKNAN